MLLACKTKISPTKNQEAVLQDLAERCRLLYNFALMERNIIWQQEKDFPVKQRQFITYQDQQNVLGNYSPALLSACCQTGKGLTPQACREREATCGAFQ